MAAKIVVEAIVYSLVYSVFMLGLFKVQGARKQLYNYPPAIQKRAIERGITTQEEMNANAKRNKVIGLIGMAFLLQKTKIKKMPEGQSRHVSHLD